MTNSLIASRACFRRGKIMMALFLVLGTFAAAANEPDAGTAADPPVEMLLWGGKIVTLDPQETLAEALAIRAGKIVAVGKDDDLRRLAGATTRKIPLNGRMVLPGLIDLNCPEEEIRTIRPVMTVVGGKVVFESN